MGSHILLKENFLQFTATELMIPVEKLSLDTKFRHISTWSSLNALIYISRINEETNVLISANDLVKSETIGDIYQLILKRSNGAG